MRRIGLTLLLFFLGVVCAFGAERTIKGRVTPMPPKVKFDPMERMRAAFEVPDPIDAYKFTVTGEVDGTVFHASNVPVFYWDEYRAPAGDLPVGSDFNPQFVKNIAGRHFYGFSREDATTKIKQVVWIDGRFLKLSKK